MRRKSSVTALCAPSIVSHSGEEGGSLSWSAFLSQSGERRGDQLSFSHSGGLRSPATRKNNTIKTVNAPWRRDEGAGYSDLTVRCQVQGADPSMCFGSSYGRCNSPKVSESAMRA
ncbi:hypothetical protein CHARACLAT_001359 [Characodon lateralis]|uniref:Uncharacterized protein n=1 Tax=Characodon lateralis TaxID=208331 RepID=A0ABU7DPG9_9TELE|nr:hypothetical protein [Characodon lateralis]